MKMNLRFVVGVAAALLLLLPLAANAQDKLPTVAVVTTEWRHNSHADVIASRLVQGHTLDGKGEFPKLKLVSAVRRSISGERHEPPAGEGARLSRSTTRSIKALTLGGEKLAVDGVLLIAEHGKYPESETGSIQFPKRRLFGEIVKVFEKSGRVVPVFSDKHIEDDWADIAWIWGEVQRLKIPLMAGSSLPGLWRYPEADVERGAAAQGNRRRLVPPARHLRLSRPGDGAVPGRAAQGRRDAASSRSAAWKATRCGPPARTARTTASCSTKRSAS